MRLKHLFKIHNSSGKKTFLFNALNFLIRRLAATWRITYTGPKIQEPAVVVLWHDQIYPLSKCMENTHSVALVSPSRDGDIVTSFTEGFGHEFIRSSSLKNSAATLRLLIKTASKRKVFVTADGPRGPRHKMKIGALLAAQKTGAPLYLIKFRTKGYRFNSWDKFLIPWPFTKIEATISEPHFIAGDLKKDALDLLLSEYEEWLNN